MGFLMFYEFDLELNVLGIETNQNNIVISSPDFQMSMSTGDGRQFESRYTGFELGLSRSS